MKMPLSSSKELPGDFEKRYKSRELKDKIADEGMWQLIPAVTGNMDSQYGLSRLEENHLLFSFIDEYFGVQPFAFEPDMRDGRYVFLPDNVSHQGIGISISRDLPGFLEISQFWYPCEFTEKKISFGPGQVSVPMFSMKPGKELADMVNEVYMKEDEISGNYCTFPFTTDIIVTLKGNFLDELEESIKTVRKCLKNENPQIQKNGEGLVDFMQWVMK